MGTFLPCHVKLSPALWVTFACTGKAADENYHTDPVRTIKMLRQLAVFDRLTSWKGIENPAIMILTEGF